MKRGRFLRSCPARNSSGISNEISLNKIELLHCDECGYVYANREGTNIKSDIAKLSREAIEAYKERQTFINELFRPVLFWSDLAQIRVRTWANPFILTILLPSPFVVKIPFITSKNFSETA